MSKTRCTNCTKLRRQLEEARRKVIALQAEIDALRPDAERWRAEMAKAQRMSDEVHGRMSEGMGELR